VYVRRLQESVSAYKSLYLMVNTRVDDRPDDRPDWKRSRGRPRGSGVQLEIDVRLELGRNDPFPVKRSSE